MYSVLNGFWLFQESRNRIYLESERLWALERRYSHIRDKPDSLTNNIHTYPSHDSPTPCPLPSTRVSISPWDPRTTTFAPTIFIFPLGWITLSLFFFSWVSTTPFSPFRSLYRIILIKMSREIWRSSLRKHSVSFYFCSLLGFSVDSVSFITLTWPEIDLIYRRFPFHWYNMKKTIATRNVNTTGSAFRDWVTENLVPVFHSLRLTGISTA